MDRKPSDIGIGGPAVTISINTAQLALVGRAVHALTAFVDGAETITEQFTAEELDELDNLVELCKETAANPDLTATYGFCV